jgi:hypothetical protein
MWEVPTGWLNKNTFKYVWLKPSHMSEREFICLDCGTHVESFLDPCPECGSQQFESTTDQSEDEHDEQITDEIAKLTRPVNPIAPAAGD